MRRLVLLPLLMACAEGEYVDPLTAFGEALIPTPSAVPYESDTLSHRSALFAEAEGLEMPNDNNAWIGMAEMTCRVQVMSGGIDADIDVQPEQTETVTDASAGGVVTLTPNTIQMIDHTGTPTETLFVPGVVDARTTADYNIVSLISEGANCSVVRSSDRDAKTSLTGACDGGAGFAIDRIRGTAFVATTEGVMRLDEGAEPALVTDGDIVSWDRTSQALYVGTDGSNTIRALDADGEELWLTKVGGPVVQIESIADAGAYVLVDLDGRGAQIWWLDPATGAPEQLMLVRTPVDALAVSPEGDRIGIATQGQIDFFDVN